VRMIDNAAADAQDFRAQMEAAGFDVDAALRAAGLKGVQQVMPHALAVSVHNLAGLNSALGHHNADIVLRHIAHEVIGGSVHAAGVPRQARSSFAMAHHGGGNFSVLLPAGGTDGQGQNWFASQAVIHKTRSEIKSRITLLNKTPIAPFLSKNGGYVDQDVYQYLEEKNLNTFGDIRDPKERSYTFGEDIIKGRVNGIHAVVVSAAVCYDPQQPDTGGGAFIGGLRTRADAMMEQYRSAMLHQLHKQGRLEGDYTPARPFYAAFNSYAMGGNAPAAFILGGADGKKIQAGEDMRAEKQGNEKPKGPGGRG